MEFFLPNLQLNESEIDRRHLSASISNLLTTVHIISDYYLPLIIVFSISFNLLSIVLLARHRLRSQALSQYLIGLTISDTLFLFCLFLIWLKYTARPTARAAGFWCQAWTYTTSISAFVSVWMMVAISVDRLLHTFLPFRRSVLGAVRRARIVCIALLCLALPTFLNVNTLAGLRQTEYGELCLRQVVFEEITSVFYFIDFTVNFLVPCLAIVLFGVVTGIQILRTSVNATRNDRDQNYFEALDIHAGESDSTIAERLRNSNDASRETISAVVAGLIFVALTCPVQALQLSIVLTGTKTTVYSGDVATYAAQKMLLILWYTRLGTTFWVRLAVDRSFRQMLFTFATKRNPNVENLSLPFDNQLEHFVEDSATDCKVGLITTEL